MLPCLYSLIRYTNSFRVSLSKFQSMIDVFICLTSSFWEFTEWKALFWISSDYWLHMLNNNLVVIVYRSVRKSADTSECLLWSWHRCFLPVLLILSLAVWGIDLDPSLFYRGENLWTNRSLLAYVIKQPVELEINLVLFDSKSIYIKKGF